MINNDSSILFIILNWNSSIDTTKCVESILPQLHTNQKVIVVDNGSTDNSVNYLKDRFPSIQIIRNNENRGFQGGMNKGICFALDNGFEFVMILNSDTVASPDMLEEILSNTPDDAAIVSPGIYYLSSPNQLCSTGGKINPILLEPIFKYHIRRYSGVKKFEFLPSHAWLIKTSVIKDTGLLDTSYFPLYYDDLDYCLRLKRKGYVLYLLPSAKIYHNVSTSMGGRNSPKERYYMARNGGFYFRKNMSHWQAPIIFIYRLGSAFLWSFRLMQGHNPEALKSYWKGFIEGWFGRLPVTQTGLK